MTTKNDNTSEDALKLLREYQKAMEEWKAKNPDPYWPGQYVSPYYAQPCPNCGHCPHCGRGGHYYRPYYTWTVSC